MSCFYPRVRLRLRLHHFASNLNKIKALTAFHAYNSTKSAAFLVPPTNKYIFRIYSVLSLYLVSVMVRITCAIISAENALSSLSDYCRVEGNTHLSVF